MAGIDDVVKGSVITAAVVGVGAVLLAPVVLPIFVSVGRPLAKSTIKGGMIVYNKGRETFAELTEVFDDLMAEARTELQAQRTGATEAQARAAGSEGPEVHPSTGTATQQAPQPGVT